MNKTKTKLNHTHFYSKIFPNVVVIQIEFGKNAIKCHKFSIFSVFLVKSFNFSISKYCYATICRWQALNGRLVVVWRVDARLAVIGREFTLCLPWLIGCWQVGTLFVDHRSILWFEFDCPLVWVTIKIDLFMLECSIQFSPLYELILRSFDTNLTIKWLGKLLYQFIGNFVMSTNKLK